MSLSFGNKSPVHNHLSSKHRRHLNETVEDAQDKKIAAPMNDEEHPEELQAQGREEQPRDK